MYQKMLGETGQIVLNKLLENVNNYSNSKFIIMDVLPSFRNILASEWYQKNVDNSYGIWLDPDASNQILINAPNITLEERKLNFPYIGFTVNNSRHTIIQYMIESEENEDGEKNGK